MTTHARLGPSDSARWLACPGSIEFTKDYPQSSSVFADEGTAAHWVREHALDLGLDAYDFIGQRVKVNGAHYDVDADMAEYLQGGIDEIREFDGPLTIEKRLDLGRWMPGQFGTLDAGVAGEHLIVISDLKYGMGVPVSAVKNTQQMIYALGFWDQVARHITEASQFLIIIDQPRNPRGGGSWSVTLDELLAFGEKVRKKAKKTLLQDAPLIPGIEQCQWCPAANMPGRPGGCPAHFGDMMSDVDIEFDDLDGDAPWEPPAIESMSPERMIRLATHAKAIENWLSYCRAEAIQYLVDNGPAAGQKAVLGRRPPRKWIDAGAAEAFIRQKLKTNDPFNRKLKTPTQVATAVGKKYEIPSTLIEQGDAKPTMASVEDNREAIKPFNDEFEDYGEEDDL